MTYILIVKSSCHIVKYLHIKGILPDCVKILISFGEIYGNSRNIIGWFLFLTIAFLRVLSISFIYNSLLFKCGLYVLYVWVGATI